MAARLEGVAEAVVVRPGDTLLVRVSPDRGIDRDGLAELQRDLREVLPGVEVGLVVADQLAVARPDPTT